MLRLLLIVVILVLILLIVGLLLWRWPMLTGRNSPAANPTHQWITIERLREVSHLMTLRIPFQQLIQTRLAGRTGSSQALVMVCGDAWLGCDLSRASVSHEAGRVLISLPEPDVVQVTIDFAASRVITVTRHGLWWCLPGNAGEELLVEQAYTQVQQQMITTVRDASNQSLARQQIERVLQQLAGDQVNLRTIWLDNTDPPQAEDSRQPP